MEEIARRFESGPEVAGRIQSDDYLDLVRKAFRTWDKADTEKRRTCQQPDHQLPGTNPGATRFDIWMTIHGELVREDSAEADLYKLLIRDLSTGGVIRQQRQTTYGGQFLKQMSRKGKTGSSSTMGSAFERTKPYVLTELGEQFVHYSMNEVVQRLSE